MFALKRTHIQFSLCTQSLPLLDVGRDPIAGPGGEIGLPGTLGDSKRVLIKRSITLSLWELCEGNSKEGLLDWDL